MIEKGLGKYHHPETDTYWKVVEWGTSRDLKTIENNRLTRRGLQNSDLTTFEIEYQNGQSRFLTFSGALPTDLDVIADYWIDNESL